MAKENYITLPEDIIEFFNERVSNFTIPVPIKFQFQGVTNQKQLIKLSKVPDQYSVIWGKDILVQVNPAYYDAIIDEDIRTILFDKEIDKIQTNPNNGIIKIGSPNLKANMGFIEKYSWDEVHRATETEKLFEQQKADKEEDVKALEPKKKSNYKK